MRNTPGEAVELPDGNNVEPPSMRIGHHPVKFRPRIFGT
jgi:hypothetical protein